MPRRNTKKEAEAFAFKVRAIVPVLTHDECYRIARALEMHAAVMDQVDRSYPDPVHRNDADLMRKLARTFLDINQGRKWIEDKDGNDQHA